MEERIYTSCVNRFKVATDKSEKIDLYTLSDGVFTYNLTPHDLKPKMAIGEMCVDNLKLSADGRIITQGFVRDTVLKADVLKDIEGGLDSAFVRCLAECSGVQRNLMPTAVFKDWLKLIKRWHPEMTPYEMLNYIQFIRIMFTESRYGRMHPQVIKLKLGVKGLRYVKLRFSTLVWVLILLSYDDKDETLEKIIKLANSNVDAFINDCALLDEMLIQIGG